MGLPRLAKYSIRVASARRAMLIHPIAHLRSWTRASYDVPLVSYLIVPVTRLCLESGDNVFEQRYKQRAIWLHCEKQRLDLQTVRV